jgi:CBS domain-containing protein
LVRDIYHPGVQWVDAVATVREVAEKMLDSHIHRLFVKDRDQLRGIITSLDLVRVLTI